RSAMGQGGSMVMADAQQVGLLLVFCGGRRGRQRVMVLGGDDDGSVVWEKQRCSRGHGCAWCISAMVASVREVEDDAGERQWVRWWMSAAVGDGARWFDGDGRCTAGWAPPFLRRRSTWKAMVMVLGGDDDGSVVWGKAEMQQRPWVCVVYLGYGGRRTRG
ncbi:hypothetical protein Dimus_028732, partial [Dionaea muscipula]